MGIIKLIKTGFKAREAFREINTARKVGAEKAATAIKQSTTLRGKLTYISAGTAGLIALAKLFDLPLSETDAASIVQGVAALVAVIGRYRASV